MHAPSTGTNSASECQARQESGATASSPPAAFVAAHLRRNLSVLTADHGLFGLGLTFASSSTILPAFAERLGASNLVIGAIPSIMMLGWSLPSLFFANHTERLPRKLRFILTYTIWERLPWLLLAVAAYFLAARWPAAVLVIMLATLAVVTSAGGVLIPAWMDLIAKVIPTHYRGRLFAFGNTISAGLGLGGAVLVGYYLESFAFPLDYALSFATAFVCFMLSFAFIAVAVEPAVASDKPAVGLGVYLRQLPQVLAGDRSFSWYLVSRAVAVFGALANGFYTVFALRTLGAPEREVAGFTFALLAGQTVANLLLGFVADRVGHKPVLVAGALAAVLGNAVALASGQTVEVYVVFLCMAVGVAANIISALNLAVEFAPPAERPTYVGLLSTLTAPFQFIAPLVGGLLADYFGYRAVFAVAGLAGLVTTWILVTRVSDPRVERRQNQAA